MEQRMIVQLVVTCTTPLHENVFKLLILLGTQLWVAFARVLANYFPLQTNDPSAVLSTVDLNHIHEVRLELIATCEPVVRLDQGQLKEDAPTLQRCIGPGEN
jgi:hypothetical protein